MDLEDGFANLAIDSEDGREVRKEESALAFDQIFSNLESAMEKQLQQEATFKLELEMIQSANNVVVKECQIVEAANTQINQKTLELYRHMQTLQQMLNEVEDQTISSVDAELLMENNVKYLEMKLQAEKDKTGHFEKYLNDTVTEFRNVYQQKYVLNDNLQRTQISAEKRMQLLDEENKCRDLHLKLLHLNDPGRKAATVNNFVETLRAGVIEMAEIYLGVVKEKQHDDNQSLVHQIISTNFSSNDVELISQPPIVDIDNKQVNSAAVDAFDDKQKEVVGEISTDVPMPTQHNDEDTFFQHFQQHNDFQMNVHFEPSFTFDPAIVNVKLDGPSFSDNFTFKF